jgi:hypothetical protein
MLSLKNHYHFKFYHIILHHHPLSTSITRTVAGPWGKLILFGKEPNKERDGPFLVPPPAGRNEREIDCVCPRLRLPHKNEAAGQALRTNQPLAPEANTHTQTQAGEPSARACQGDHARARKRQSREASRPDAGGGARRRGVGDRP